MHGFAWHIGQIYSAKFGEAPADIRAQPRHRFVETVERIAQDDARLLFNRMPALSRPLAQAIDRLLVHNYGT